MSAIIIPSHTTLAQSLYSSARSEPVEEYLRALEEILLPQFSFHSKPGSPSKETEDGVKQVQDERKQETIKNMLSTSSNNMAIHSYYIKRLSQSTYFLSRLYKQNYWYKPCHIIKKDDSIQIDSIIFFHHKTRSCLQKMLQTGSLKPLLILLQKVKNYHLLQDNLFFREFFLLIFIVYKQILFHECEKSSHTLKKTTLETIIIISNTISQLPIAEVLNAIDMLIVELPPFLEKYEFHSSIGWKTWLKKYWWVPPIFGVWFGLKILLRLQRPFFYYSPYTPRPQVPLGEQIPVVTTSEHIATNDPALDDIMNTTIFYR